MFISSFTEFLIAAPSVRVAVESTFTFVYRVFVFYLLASYSAPVSATFARRSPQMPSAITGLFYRVSPGHRPLSGWPHLRPLPSFSRVSLPIRRFVSRPACASTFTDFFSTYLFIFWVPDVSPLFRRRVRPWPWLVSVTMAVYRVSSSLDAFFSSVFPFFLH